MVEAFDAVHSVAFYAGGVPHSVTVRHISHGDAFKVRGLANAVLSVFG